MACMSLPTLLSLLLLAPLAEEALFRGGLQELLLRRGWAAAPANLASTAAFGLAHGVARSWALGLAVCAPSLALGWLYARRRRLMPCIAAHAAFNACWIGLTS